MREYGLIGFPLSHSFSKKYFTEKFHRENITDACFENFSIPDIDEVKAMLKRHPLLEGFAITIPYKKLIIPYLDSISDEVKSIGACNCVKIKNGQLHGYNTDIIGFEKSFIKKLQPHQTQALILGTGGASLAVSFVLKKLKIEYHFVSRKADMKKGILGYNDLNADTLKEHTIIINTTPLGTFPDTDQAPEIPYNLITAHNYLFDLIYNPPLTRFMQLGLQQNCVVENGYEMLVLQAEENWKIWTTE